MIIKQHIQYIISFTIGIIVFYIANLFYELPKIKIPELVKINPVIFFDIGLDVLLIYAVFYLSLMILFYIFRNFKITRRNKEKQ